jgi:DNA invertase Pin-like site-specific DNA recombinase
VNRVAQSSASITTALIYTRVSSEDQAREGISLDAQLAECRRYAATKNWVIGDEYQDVLSGSRDDRPRYQALLSVVRRLRLEGCDAVVVVAALDRFGRRLLERVRSREELKSLGVPLHSVREGGEVSDLMANMLAVMAQEEVQRLSGRVSAAKQHIIASGWTSGGRGAWGYRTRDATPDERAAGAPRRILDVDPDTAPYAREMFARAAAGQSVRSVAAWTVRLPESARGGRKLSYTLVRFLLRSPIYVSRPEQGTANVLDRSAGRWPALVDDATWQAVQDRFELHKSMPRQASGRFLLTGLARCPKCGGRMIGARRKDGARPVYRCMNGVIATVNSCHHSATAPIVESSVVSEVASLLAVVTSNDRRVRDALGRTWRALSTPETGTGVAKRIQALEREGERARERLRNAALLLIDGSLDKVGYGLARDQAQKDLEAVDEELGRLRDQKPGAGLPPLVDVLRDAGDWYRILRESEILAQRDVLTVLIEHVVLVRTGWRAYAAQITWTPLGEALRKVSAAYIAA